MKTAITDDDPYSTFYKELVRRYNKRTTIGLTLLRPVIVGGKNG